MGRWRCDTRGRLRVVAAPGLPPVAPLPPPLGVRALLLLPQPPLIDPARDARRPPRLGRRRGGLGEERGEAYGAGLAVAPLRTGLGGADGDDAVDEPPGQPVQRPLLP